MKEEAVEVVMLVLNMTDFSLVPSITFAGKYHQERSLNKE